jgi:hypothetical protein
MRWNDYQKNVFLAQSGEIPQHQTSAYDTPSERIKIEVSGKLYNISITSTSDFAFYAGNLRITTMCLLTKWRRRYSLDRIIAVGKHV